MNSERGSIIDAQITLHEEINKELKRCKDWRYWYVNYDRVVVVNGKLEYHGMIFENEADLHMYRRRTDPYYGVLIKNLNEQRTFI